LEGDTFQEIYSGILNIIERAYGSTETVSLGPKEVWVGEFIPALHRSFPDTRFIYIIRDPRAVFASKQHRETKYPWLFLARQWRKLAALGWWYAHRADRLAARFHLLFFEDLIQKPEETTRALCDFLQVPWEKAMISPASYVDGRGNPWRQNTAYASRAGGSIDPATLTRWRQALNKPEIRMIEYLCGLEMQALGYELELGTDFADVGRLIVDPPHVAERDLAPWITRFEDNTLERVLLELETEMIRFDLVRQNGRLDRNKYAALLDLCFLEKDLFDLVKEKNPLKNRAGALKEMH